jgi:hypothetical protein
MKKAILVLMSFIFVFSTLGAMAADDDDDFLILSIPPIIASTVNRSPSPLPLPTTFGDIHPLLVADCYSSCHADGRGGYWVYDTISPSYQPAVAQTNTITPDLSPLLRKSIGLDSHKGGAPYVLNGPEYNLIRKWITDGVLPP